MPSPPNHISVSLPIFICKLQKHHSDDIALEIPAISSLKYWANTEKVHWVRVSFQSWRASRTCGLLCRPLSLCRAAIDTRGSAAQGKDAACLNRDLLSFAISFFRDLCGLWGFPFAIPLRRHLGPHQNWRIRKELIRPGHLRLKQTELVKLRMCHSEMITFFWEKKTKTWNSWVGEVIFFFLLWLHWNSFQLRLI